jgi:hypothetical protein
LEWQIDWLADEPGGMASGARERQKNGAKAIAKRKEWPGATSKANCSERRKNEWKKGGENGCFCHGGGGVE